MNSTGTVVRDDGDPTFNSETGQTVQPETTVYTGDILVRTAAWEGSDTGVAETEIRRRPWRLKLPHDAPALFKDDRLTVTASDNAALVDRVLRITDFYGDDWSPNAPYFAEEVT